MQPLARTAGANYQCRVYGCRRLRMYTPNMESQMDKKIETEIVNRFTRVI